MAADDRKNNDSKTDSRREFLKTAGKFAVYTPPALMMMSQANALDIHKSCTILDGGDSMYQCPD